MKKLQLLVLKMKKLKLLASEVLVLLSFSMLQIHSSQAMDTMAVSLVQPDGTKKAMKLNLDQPLSELRIMLVQKGISILPDDKFLTKMGELSPRDEAGWKVREAIDGNVLSLKHRGGMLQEAPHSITSYNLVEQIPIPLVARGHEAIYRKFLNGVLIHRPTEETYGRDVGMIKMPIRDLKNPLEGTFPVWRCDEDQFIYKHVTISTGYRKRIDPKNTEGKIEIWIAPRFLIEQELKTTAAYFKPIMKKWKSKAPVGIFWTWSSEMFNLENYAYLTSQPMNELGDQNLYEKWKSGSAKWGGYFDEPTWLSGFYISFEN